MVEAAGPATQEGIYYQNSVAAKYLADLLNLRRVSPRERVVEVRVESLADVDDILVVYADGHRDLVQAKSNLRASGNAWRGLWGSFARQASQPTFGSDDRLVIALGKRGKVADHLEAMAERASTSDCNAEWLSRLGADVVKTLNSITKVLGNQISAYELFCSIDVKVATHRDIESFFCRLDIGTASFPPMRLLSSLRDLVGGSARLRGVFRTEPLRTKLAADFELDVFEPREWGLAAYRQVIRSTRVELPGRGVSAPVEDIVVWPRARRLGTTPECDFEDEMPGWDTIEREGGVDLSQFPNNELERCVLVAGPGFGKSTLASAVAAKLVDTPIVPVEVPLGTFATTEDSVVDYLETRVNRDFSVRIDWRTLAEQGLVCAIFDGLDEVPTNKRPGLIKRIGLFSARFSRVPWLLTVRDPAALSGPLDAELIDLEPFGNHEIMELVTKFEKWSPGLDAWDFTDNLQAYPELAKLARIPLFLSIMLASWTPGAPLPKKRTDLIEAYLRRLFDPDKRTNAEPGLSVSVLRSIAEAIAFTSLEREEIGLSERQASEVIANHGAEPKDAVLAHLLAGGVLRRRIDGRLQFPYPIVQEYLAAVHLVDVAQDQVAARVGDVARRPWAQVVQFALELLPDPSPHIRKMLEAPDDAFSTGLRLIGRCVANGAAVEPDLHAEIGGKLAQLWGEAAYTARNKVGRLLVDGFSNPLHPEVRRRLGWRWLLGAGVGEIVNNAADPALTVGVIDELLEGKLDVFMNLRDLQTAFQPVAPEVAAKVTVRADRQGMTEEEAWGLAEFLELIQLDAEHSHLLRALAEDAAMPLCLRFGAHAAMAGPPSPSAIAMALTALSDNDWRHRYAALKVLRRAGDVTSLVERILSDRSIPVEAQGYLLESLHMLIPDEATRGEAIRRIIQVPNLTIRHQHILRVYALRGGDRQAFVEMIEALDHAELDVAQAVLASLNRFPEKDLGDRAKEKMEARSDPPAAIPNLVVSIVTGLTSAISPTGWDGYAVDPAPPHPSMSAWTPVFDEWLATEGLTKVQRIRIISSVLKMKPELLSDLEDIVFSATDPDTPEWDEDDYGHYLREAMETLRRHRVKIPLELAEVFALAKRPNIPYAGIAAIVANATLEALHLLMSLYHRVDKNNRSIVFEAIEVLSGRLGVRIASHDLRSAS